MLAKTKMSSNENNGAREETWDTRKSFGFSWMLTEMALLGCWHPACCCQIHCITRVYYVPPAALRLNVVLSLLEWYM